MTARKTFSQLAPSTQQRRMAVMLDNHVPVPRGPVLTQAMRHAKCANRANCTGPGCRITR